MNISSLKDAAGNDAKQAISKYEEDFLKLPMELILPPSRILGFGKRANSSSVKSLLRPTQSAHTACFLTFSFLLGRDRSDGI